ncbi:hypothetical protein [Fibrella aquatica]|uniref:hypothetical protein n=1 Tax=Fibrella aquatica TaxID=3242487 RepID=UPI00352289B6
MKEFHFILQAKGGVGKSYFAYLQALRLENEPGALFIDIDNSTRTTTRQLAFLKKQKRVANISLFNERDKQDRQRLPAILVELATEPFNKYYLDFGAPESEQFPAMLRQDFSAQLLQTVEQHIQAKFIFHCIIAGNTAFKSCMEYLVELANQLYNIFPIEVQLNEFSVTGQSGESEKEQRAILANLCKQHSLPLKSFGRIDPTDAPGRNIVHYAQTGKGLSEFGFIEGLMMKQELEKM